MAEQGSVWIDGTDLHFLAEDGTHWYYTGNTVSTPAGISHGSMWVDTATLYYIDQNGTERSIGNVQMSTVPGKPGSAWVNGTFIHWVSTTGHDYYGHSDVAHADRAGYGDYGDTHVHSDVPYNNAAHIDVPGPYNNVAGSSSHCDQSHGDWQPYCDVTGCASSHGDYAACSSHSDTPHTDTQYSYTNYPHTDSAYNNRAAYGDYGDSWPYTNVAHADMPLQGVPV